MRGEGFTEQTGDIVISCTGGAVITSPITVGGVQTAAPIPLVNIQVNYNAPVTSRLLPVSATTTAQGVSNASEALLMVDEPGSGLPGFGPGLPQVLCTTPATGCSAGLVCRLVLVAWFRPLRHR
jgi:hypothetical protein